MSGETHSLKIIHERYDLLLNEVRLIPFKITLEILGSDSEGNPIIVADCSNLCSVLAPQAGKPNPGSPPTCPFLPEIKGTRVLPICLPFADEETIPQTLEEETAYLKTIIFR